MIFTSIKYLLFLVIVLILYYVVPVKLQNYILLIANFYFYYSAMPKMVWLLVITCVFTYCNSHFLNKIQNSVLRKTTLTFSVVVVLAPLLYYKYAGFLLDVFSIEIGAPLKLIAPLGISFYTFQAIGYLIDVNNKTIEPISSVVNCVLYLTFFPQLLSGPISRAKKMFPQYDAPRKYEDKNIGYGVSRFIVGMFKKVVIADNIGLIVDTYYKAPSNYANTFVSLVVFCAYSVQIYFDFAGYSDMAIASGRLFGITLPENFNVPFLSTDMSGYWKRWHMSLTTWLTDYIFVPLVWSRWFNKLFYGKKWQDKDVHVITNILIVFLVSGIWHGASYTFIVWGLLHGIFRVIEELINRHKKKSKKKSKIRIVGYVKVFTLSALAHVFFRALSIGEAFEVLGYLLRPLGIRGSISNIMLLIYTAYNGSVPVAKFTCILLLIALSIGVYLDIVQNGLKNTNDFKYHPILSLKPAAIWMLLILIYLCIIMIGVFGVSNFIYFQF